MQNPMDQDQIEVELVLMRSAQNEELASSALAPYSLACCDYLNCELEVIFEHSPPNSVQPYEVGETEFATESREVSLNDVFMGVSDAENEIEYSQLLEARNTSVAGEPAEYFKEMFDGNYNMEEDYVLFEGLNEEPIEMEMIEEPTKGLKENPEEEIIIAAKTEPVKKKRAPRRMGGKFPSRFSKTLYLPISQLQFTKFFTPIDGKYLKPPFTFTVLIAFAIKISKKESLEVGQIYRKILECFPYFRTAEDHWRNSVRHNLSFAAWFQKTGWRRNTVKGHGWMLANGVDCELRKHCVFDYTKLFHCVSKAEICYMLQLCGLLNAVCNN